MGNRCEQGYKQIPLKFAREKPLLISVVRVSVANVNTIRITVDALMVKEEEASLRLVYEVHQVFIDPFHLMVPLEAKEN